MTRHPSSAELAEFRRWLHTRSDELQPMHPDETHPRGVVAQRAAPGAWPRELRDGIGYRYSNDDPDLTWCGASCCEGALRNDRREASAMRSRAYARRVVVASVRPDELERAYGVPYAWRGSFPWRTADWPAL